MSFSMLRVVLSIIKIHSIFALNKFMLWFSSKLVGLFHGSFNVDFLKIPIK